MRSIEDIRDTGAAWVTEAEVAMLCAFAKRAETSEMEVARLTREVARLEGLILDWEVYRPGRGDHINNLLVEARRIRAQREDKP